MSMSNLIWINTKIMDMKMQSIQGPNMFCFENYKLLEVM
jgi:hypothetical protein